MPTFELSLMPTSSGVSVIPTPASYGQDSASCPLYIRTLQLTIDEGRANRHRIRNGIQTCRTPAAGVCAFSQGGMLSV